MEALLARVVQEDAGFQIGLEHGERPKVSAAARRPIFGGDELGQTLAAEARR